MIYDEKKIIEDAIKDIKFDEFNIRTADPSEMISEQSLIGDGKYALWALVDVNLINEKDWKKGDIWINISGKECDYPTARAALGSTDGILKYTGGYPIRKDNLNFPINMKKLEENKFEVSFGEDYSVVIRFEKSEYVKKTVTGGYQGAGSWREYYETIDEQPTVSYDPLYDVFFNDTLVVSHISRPAFFSDLYFRNIKFSESGFSLDYGYTGIYISNQNWVNVCISKDSVCVPQGVPEAVKSDMMKAEDIPAGSSVN